MHSICMHLAVHAVGAVLAPQLREVLQAVAPVLAAPGVELLVLVLARLKVLQVLLRSVRKKRSGCLSGT